jgi:hypothetical protein
VKVRSYYVGLYNWMIGFDYTKEFGVYLRLGPLGIEFIKDEWLKNRDFDPSHRFSEGPGVKL